MHCAGKYNSGDSKRPLFYFPVYYIMCELCFVTFLPKIIKSSWYMLKS